MKTITEVAKSLGVSRQTIYNAIAKSDSVDIESLTKGRRGQARLFDEESERIVKELLSEQCQENVKKRKTDNEIDNKNKQIEELKTKLTEAEERIETLTAEKKQMEEDNRILIRTNATQAVTIQNLQEQNQLKLANGTKDHPDGWFRRAIKRITGKGKEQNN